MNLRMATVVVGLAVCFATVVWCGEQRGARTQGVVLVRDRSGAPLAHAKVRLYRGYDEAGSHSVVATNAGGKARFVFVRGDTHQLQVVCDGYQLRHLTAVTFPVEVVLARSKPR